MSAQNVGSYRPNLRPVPLPHWKSQPFVLPCKLTRRRNALSIHSLKGRPVRVLSLTGTKCHLSSTSPLNHPFKVSMTKRSVAAWDSSQKVRSPSMDRSGTSSPRSPAPMAASMKHTVSSRFSLVPLLEDECHFDSATLQTAKANRDVKASFYFLIIPILNRAPLMKQPYHFPKV